MNFVERRFPVFRTGTHMDSEGRSRTWSAADLARMVAAYDPAHHEAPVVIGHPKDNAPAYGWVKGLIHRHGILYADADLAPELEEMVKKGLFRKRSVSLYKDGTLRHVGFLGAAPPAVKGLADIQFHDGDGALYEFGGPEGIKEKGGKKMKFMDWLTQTARREGVVLDDLPGAGETDFSEAQRKKEEELTAREEKVRERETEARKAAIASFCEGLEKEGRLTPAMMKAGMGMTAFLESVAAMETPIDYGEGDGKARQTPLEFMEDFLKGLPRAIEFREIATDDKDVGIGAGQKRERLVTDYMEKNPKASYRDAVLAVSGENPELFKDSR
jgi:hypothetical protein